MKRILFMLGTVLALSSLIGGAVLMAHFDEASDKIGEYEVRLNSLKVLSFDDNAIFGLDEPRPDLFISTFTQAETHVGLVAAFGEFTDVTVGNLVGIGRLIYWHLDCPDSEKLQLIVDVADRDGGDFGPLLKGLLQVGVGILAQSQPGAAPGVNAAAQPILAAIAAELSASDQFPQVNTGGDFTIDDNAGTQKFTSAVGGVGMSGQYEFSASFNYRERDIKCTDKNIFELQQELVRFDTEKKQIKERLVNLALQSGTEKTSRAVTEGLLTPTAKLQYALAETDIQNFSVGVSGERVGITVNTNLEEFTVFYIIGAAATAFVDTPVRRVVLNLPASTYIASRGAVVRFLRAPQELIGTGMFIDNLLAGIVVQDATGST